MVLDFTTIQTGQTTFGEFAHTIDHKSLPQHTKDLFEEICTSISDISDEDLSFIPHDPAQPGSDGWTLSHVIAHVTAGLEEAAAGAAMLARGVRIEGRLHAEIPWETLTTVQQVQQRLQESQRMCLAFLNAWPDTPALDVTITPMASFGPLNAVGIHIAGLMHATSHLEQLREIVRQSQERKSCKR